MKKFLAITALMVASIGAFAQTWSSTLFYSFKTNQTAIVATHKIGQATNVLGTGKTLDLNAFAGANLGNGAGILGVSLGKSRQLADNVSLSYGLGVAWTSGQELKDILKDLNIGPTVGLTWKF